MVASPARLHRKAAVAAAAPCARLRRAIVPGIDLHVLVARIGAVRGLRSPVADGGASRPVARTAGGGGTAAEVVVVAVRLLLLLRLLRSLGGEPAGQRAQPSPAAVARAGEALAAGAIVARRPLARLRSTDGAAAGAVGDALVLALVFAAADTRVPVQPDSSADFQHRPG